MTIASLKKKKRTKEANMNQNKIATYLLVNIYSAGLICNVRVASEARASPPPPPLLRALSRLGLERVQHLGFSRPRLYDAACSTVTSQYVLPSPFHSPIRARRGGGAPRNLSGRWPIREGELGSVTHARDSIDANEPERLLG